MLITRLEERFTTRKSERLFEPWITCELPTPVSAYTPSTTEGAITAHFQAGSAGRRPHPAREPLEHEGRLGAGSHRAHQERLGTAYDDLFPQKRSQNPAGGLHAACVTFAITMLFRGRRRALFPFFVSAHSYHSLCSDQDDEPSDVYNSEAEDVDNSEAEDVDNSEAEDVDNSEAEDAKV